MNQPLVSAVVTSYNLAATHGRCLWPVLHLWEGLLTDGGSRVDQRQRRFDMGFDRLFFAGRKEGLGAHLNKEIRAARVYSSS